MLKKPKNSSGKKGISNNPDTENVFYYPYHEIQDQMLAIVWTVDKNLVFTSIDGSGLSILGIERDQVVGMDLREFHGDSENVEESVANHKKVLKGESVTHVVKWKDSFLLSNIQPTYNKNNEIDGCLGISIDITARIEDEQKLKESESIFRQLAQTTNAQIFIYQDEFIVWANKTAEEFIGYSLDELSSMKSVDIIHPDMREIASQRARERISGESVINRYELKIITKDGKTKWLDYCGAKITFRGKPAIMGTALDITERKIAEEALRESENKYRTLFEKSADPILIIEGERFVDCNSATIKMLGYKSKQELLDTHPSELSPEMQPDGRSSFEKANEILSIAFSKGSHRFEWDHMRQNGEVFPVEVLLTSVPSGERNFLHVVWRDITERKETESALKESESIFKQLSNSTTALILIYQDNRIVWVNPTYVKVLGYSKEELYGMKSLDMIHPDMKELAEQRARDRIDGKNVPSRYEIKVLTKDNKIKWLDFSGSVINYKKRPAIMGTCLDITERIEAETALKESESIFVQLAKSTNAMFIIYQQQTILWANSTTTNITGYSNKELLGMSPIDLVHPETRELIEKRIENRFKEEKMVSRYEVKLLSKNNKVKWLDYAVSKIKYKGTEAMMATCFEITERIEAEAALKESEINYKDIVNTSQEGIWRIDKNANTDFANEHMAEMLGYTVDEMMGKSMYFFMDKDGIRIAENNFQRRKDGVSEEHEFKFQTKDGADLWALLSTSPSTDEKGEFAGALAMVIDITNRKKTEQKLKTATDQLKIDQKSLEDQNIALKKVLDHIELDKKEYQHKICERLDLAIIPVLERLKVNVDPEQASEIGLIESNVKAILNQDMDVFKGLFERLTPRELDICHHIRSGVSSKEISNNLNISVVTVHKHREKIRKKLGLTNQNLNLVAYLRLHDYSY